MIARHPIVWRMSRGYALLLLAIALAALAIASSDSNTALFLELQRAMRALPPSLGPVFWESLTYAGDTLAAFALATVLLARRPDMAWAALIAGIPGGIYTHALKAMFPTPRPPAVLAPDALIVLGPVLKQGSFPSGHSVTAGVLAGIIVLAFPRASVRALALVLAAAIGLSRVAVGVHWPLDVVAGLFGGLVSAWIGVCVAQRQPWATTPDARMVASVILGGCAIALPFHPAGLPGASAFRYALAIGAIALASVSFHHAVGDRRRAIGRAAGPH